MAEEFTEERKKTAGKSGPGKRGRPKNPPSINLPIFLPARRTSLYHVDDAFDMDALHQECWERRDPRNDNRLEARPYDNNMYILANGISQGRWRREGKQAKYYVKDPEVWAAEAVDFRELETEPGMVRCDYCAFVEPEPANPMAHHVACNTCLVLLGLDPYAEEDAK